MTDQRTMLHNAYSNGRHVDILLGRFLSYDYNFICPTRRLSIYKPMFGNIIQCHSNCKGVPLKPKLCLCKLSLDLLKLCTIIVT